MKITGYRYRLQKFSHRDGIWVTQTHADVPNGQPVPEWVPYWGPLNVIRLYPSKRSSIWDIRVRLVREPLIEE